MSPVEARTSHKELFEPITDPRKNDVHFRAAKHKILRSLGIASYRNGCQFVMLWVNPTGEVADAYASEALQPKLEDWLGHPVQTEAKDVVKAWKADKERRKRLGEESIEPEGVYGPEGDMFEPDQVDEDMSDAEGVDRQKRSTRSTRGLDLANSTRMARVSEGLSTPDDYASITSSESAHRTTGSLDLTLQQHPSPALSATNSVTSPTLATSSLSSDEQDPRRMTREDFDTWFTTRLKDLSHRTDKVVCRSWIKAIEPHKQSNFPYHKGDETKPIWWPREIRHKEPDHLGKHERVALLLHILRSPRVTIVELEASTAANQVQIPAHKMPILQRIYQYAKVERKMDPLKYQNSPIASSKARLEDEGDLQTPLLHVEMRSTRPQRTRVKHASESPNVADHNAMQQTPRTARASPYPLARSASASHELSNLSLNGGNSPGLAGSPGAASLSRSQSYAGLTVNSSSGRAPRLNGRASIGEGDLHATPYQGGRVRTTVTPRSGAASQGSPLSASMGRSASTSAIGAKTMMDDSVASPAMIKSRSKLSQKCFEQMGAGPIGTGQGARGGEGGGPARLDSNGMPAEYGQFPQPQFTMIHPHHLQSMRSHPEGFPPPLPVPIPVQHQLVSRHPAQNPLPHPHHPQVQVQVQVNAGHGLPIPPPQSHHPAYAFSPQQHFANSPVPQPSPNFPAPNLLQTQHQSIQFNTSDGNVYKEHSLPTRLPTNDEATFFATTGGNPSLSGYIHSPELSHRGFQADRDHEYVIVPTSVENGGVVSQSGAGTSSGGYDSNAYVDPGQFNPGSLEPDLGAYVRQLEGFERQQTQQPPQLPPQPSGIEGGYELGLGLVGATSHADLGAYEGFYY